LSPRDGVAFREIQAATGHTIEPWIALEPRLFQAIERHFKLRFAGKTGLTLPRGPGEGPPAAPRRSDDDSAAPEVPEPEVGLDGRPLDAEAVVEDYEPTGSGPRAPGEVGSMEALDDALSAARDRDEMAAAIFTFCAGRAGRSALFAVGKDAIRGVAGRGRAFDNERLRKFSVAVGTGTLFDTALQSRDFYFGVVPSLPANRDLYTALGGRLPTHVMLLPVFVKERTVALLYLDGDDGPLPRPDIPLMRRVAAKAGLAFEMLLMRNKLREI
jgi:hypothetical protein